MKLPQNISLSRETDAPMYIGLKTKLLELLAGGEFKQGQRFYSYRRLASASGVSRITAQLAAKELVKEGWLKQVPNKGAVVARLPGKDLDSLVKWRVGLVLSPWDHEDALAWNDGRILPGMLDEGRLAGVGLEMLPCELASGGISAFEKRVNDSGLDGLLWLSMRLPVLGMVSRWCERGLPQVAVSSRAPGIHIPLVAPAEKQAAREATELVIKEGHSRVLVIHFFPDTSFSTVERLSGLREVLSEYHKDWPDEWFIAAPETPRPKWLGVVLEQALKQTDPTAVVMLADATAELTLAVQKLGKELGKDIRLVSFHPPQACASSVPGRMTYFWPPLRDIGRSSVRLWLQVRKEMASDSKLRPSWTRTLPMKKCEYRSAHTEGYMRQGHRASLRNETVKV